MYTNDKCKYWDIQVKGLGDCIEYCIKYNHNLVKGNDCTDCKLNDKTSQSKLF